MKQVRSSRKIEEEDRVFIRDFIQYKNARSNEIKQIMADKRAQIRALRDEIEELDIEKSRMIRSTGNLAKQFNVRIQTIHTIGRGEMWE